MVTKQFYVEGSGRGRGATPMSTARPTRPGPRATRAERVRYNMAMQERNRELRSRQRAAAAATRRQRTGRR